MSSFLRSLSFAVLVSFTVPALAQMEAESQKTAPAKSYFVAPSVIDVKTVLPAPPEAGSLAAAADLEVVLRVQASRTPDEIAFAQKISNDDVFDFADVLGPWFTKQNLPYTAIFLKHVSSDAASISSLFKKTYTRPRPPAVAPTVKPVVEIPTSFSYPSGHSMRAFVWAAVLSDLYPDKREALFERAHAGAWARVVGGVHFPTDLIGGRILAAKIVAELEKNPDFHAAVKQAREEAAPFLLKKAA
jgi:acid phosphatase (class A)